MYRRWNTKTQYFDIAGDAVVFAPFGVGDKIIHTSTNAISDLKKDSVCVVEAMRISTTRNQSYIETKEIDGKRSSGYYYVSNIEIKLVGFPNWYSFANFTKVNEMSVIAIEQDRPCFAREFIEVADATTGKSTRDYTGPFIPFESLSAARTFTTGEIVNSIRMTNVYRKFAIFVENSVAQAKEPQIEFK